MRFGIAAENGGFPLGAAYADIVYLHLDQPIQHGVHFLRCINALHYARLPNPGSG